jgi:hypothetical protein
MKTEFSFDIPILFMVVFIAQMIALNALHPEWGEPTVYLISTFWAYALVNLGTYYVKKED